MKTKSTSDTLVIERCCNDIFDPITRYHTVHCFNFWEAKVKEVKTFSFIYISFLLNSHQLGDLYYAIYTFVSNFSTSRYRSRALIIPFNSPSIGPNSTEDHEFFSDLISAQKEASPVVGWIVSLRKQFLEGGIKEINQWMWGKNLLELIPVSAQAMPVCCIFLRRYTLQLAITNIFKML